MKIYSDYPNLPYKTTKLKALYTKSEIDGLFAKWGVKDTYWHWDPEHNDVFVQFKIVEEIEGKPLQVSAKVEAPAIWDHKTRSNAETVNWDISMRVMYWFIKSHLEAAYLLQSSKTAAFLPYIAFGNGTETLKDRVAPMLNEIQHLPALTKNSAPRIIDVDPARIVERTRVVLEQKFGMILSETGIPLHSPMWRVYRPECHEWILAGTVEVEGVGALDHSPTYDKQDPLSRKPHLEYSDKRLAARAADFPVAHVSGKRLAVSAVEFPLVLANLEAKIDALVGQFERLAASNERLTDILGKAANFEAPDPRELVEGQKKLGEYVS